MPSPVRRRARAAACRPRCSSRSPTSVLPQTCRDRSSGLLLLHRLLLLRGLAGFRGRAPHKNCLRPVHLLVGHHALGLGRVVEPNRRCRLVGGHQYALQTTFAPLSFGADDVAQSQRHGLADGPSEVGRRAQAAFETGTADLEGVVPGHRVVVIELAPDQPRDQGDGFEIEALLHTCRAIDGDAQRAAAELEVVQLEVQIRDDGDDEPLDLAQHRVQRGAVAHLISSPGLYLGPISKEGVDRCGPRLQFIELQRTHRVYRLAGSVSPRPAPYPKVTAVLRLSTMFLRTLREDPVDAEVASHRLLVRAGYIRRAAPGGFTWLPIGWIVYQNVERVIREEMDRAGFQEVHFPALLPR